MLVLQRRLNESIYLSIEHEHRLVVTGIVTPMLVNGNKVRLLVRTGPAVSVHRGEMLCERTRKGSVGDLPSVDATDFGNLVQTRRKDERSWIGTDCVLTVVDVLGSARRENRRARLAIDAPPTVLVHRSEVFLSILTERSQSLADALTRSVTAAAGA